MEGLEVAVIDRWRVCYPDRTTSELTGWLAARQLFVALIMTSATLLANRDTIIVPGTSTTIDGRLLLGLFDLTWTGFTVLWFAQIFPKDLAATNPDRYLEHLRRLFPVVEVVRKIGVSQPGEWGRRPRRAPAQLAAHPRRGDPGRGLATRGVAGAHLARAHSRPSPCASRLGLSRNTSARTADSVGDRATRGRPARGRSSAGHP